ncbi:hypothetical protein ACFV6F_17660 [Kitasatospora phosalacinea]|uniref:hypothetical protein n=1 Tax=Kitasatospora phosalacinea TaxID=2065 RepID=UPI00366821B1
MSAPEPQSVGELADRLRRPASVPLVLPRLVLPGLQLAEDLAALTKGGRSPVGYVVTSGSGTVRTLSRLELDAPCLRVWCHLRDGERVFTVSRIHGVMPA